VIDVDDQNGPMRRLAAARRDFPERSLLKGMEDQPVRLGLHTAEARVLHTGESALVPEVTDEWLAAATLEDDPAGAFSALRPCSLMMVTLYAGPLRWGVVTMMTCDPSRRYGAPDLALAEELVRRAGINLENARLFRFAQEASRAKSDFLAIVSHELRTPLSAIIGYTGLLEEGIAGDLNDRQRDYLASVRKSADHLIGLIEQVITFARLEGAHERVRVEAVDLARLARDTGTLTRPLADRKGLALTLDVVPEGTTFSSDGKKIAQILVNLVTNAIKYTDTGEVRMETELVDGEVVLRVRDTGPGIPPDKLGVIFEPFRQLEDPRTRKEGGTGIGLSIVKNLTQLLGGEVGVASRPGEGSTFTVRLPPLSEEKPAG
jgi:signal transduction histidine kinase